MPKKGGTAHASATGYIVLRMNAQRKLLLSELMQREGITDPQVAMDVAMQVGANVVAPAVETVADLPELLNYYAGGRLLDRASNDELTDDRGVFESATWLDNVSANEGSVTNSTEAFEFSLLAYIALRRAGTITDKQVSEYKASAALARKELVKTTKTFRKENVSVQRNKAMLAAAMGERKEKAKKRKPTKTYTKSIATNEGKLFAALQGFKKAVEEKDARAQASFAERIAFLEERGRRINSGLEVKSDEIADDIAF